MKINEVIQKMKDYCLGEEIDYDNLEKSHKPIDEATTRDQILFGKEYADNECTGIITTCWANVDVIKEAIDKGVNLIICHEALFWNHGDRTDWLIKNKTFLNKKALLAEHEIVVWRNHDYIHSGIPVNGKYVDGIFYGVANELGWVDYIAKDMHRPMYYQIPETTVKELSDFLIHRLKLNGVKVLGNENAKVSKVMIPLHIFGDANNYISYADAGEVNCFLTMEMVDFTLAEYVRDASMSGNEISIISMGHFNTEEPGMKYMLSYIPEVLKEDIPAYFIQSGDNYNFITR